MAFIFVLIALLPLTSNAAVYSAANITGKGHLQESFAQKATAFRDDSRQELHDRKYPWGAVGILKNPDGGSCTASVVGRNLLLTNAHCVLYKDRKEIRKGNYVFYAGYSRGSYVAKTTILHFWVGTTDSRGDTQNDWALLRTQWNIGDRVGWLGVRRYTAQELVDISFSTVFYLVGYPSDMTSGEVPYWEKNCNFTFTLGETVYHSCSTSSGSSGAPMFINKDDEVRILAVNVGERRNGAKRSVIGVPYSEDYANVAVPSATFIEKIKELQ